MKRRFQSIPLVDLSAFTSGIGTESAKRKAGKELDLAFKTTGFAYLKGHGITPSLLYEMREKSRSFFQLPVEEKESISLVKSSSFRGYQRLGLNVTRNTPDSHEAIDFQREYPPEHFLAKESQNCRLIGPNQWPNETLLPDFRSTFDQYVSEMLTLGNHTARAIAVGLQLPEDYFNPFFNDSHWLCRVIRYPPKQNFEAETVGCGQHTDYGCLTFVNQDEIPGTLQVKNSAGEWINADPIEDAIVTNVGDMLEMWTNGMYRATPHRVLTADQSRVSAPFFFEPNYTAIVEPIGTVNSKTSVMYGQHLYSKLSTNFL